MTDKKNNFAKDINVPNKEQIHDSLKNQDKNFNENSSQEKEQIMIDGCNVSGCIFFDKDNEYNICCYDDTREDKIPFANFCVENKDCHYKQLTRKTQECIKLNNKIIDMNSIIEDAAINLGNKDFTLYDLPFEIKKLSHECEQIKEKYEALKLENEEGYEIVAELKHKCEELEKLVQQAQEAPICFQCEQEPCIRQERDRYRKALEEALEEIEKELKEDIYCESQECGCDDFEECLKCTKEHILDIINKVKGEE